MMRPRALPWHKKICVIAPLCVSLGLSPLGYIGGKKFLDRYPLTLQCAWAALKDPFTVTELERTIEKEFDIQIVWDKSPDTLMALQKHLRRIRATNPKLLEHVNSVYIVPKEYRDNAKGTHAWPPGQITINRTALEVLAHETAHVRHYNLAAMLEFNHEWQEVAGDAYTYYRRDNTGESFWDGYEHGPLHGCACAYGAQNVYEDVATLVEEVYASSSSLVRADPADQRYKQKYDLLLAYGFVTQEQHTRMLSILGRDYAGER